MTHDTSQFVRVIDREGETHVVPWQPEETLMEALRDNGLPILASCGGVCACATCHVHIQEDLKDKLGTRGDNENELLGAEIKFRSDVSRLSCQIKYDEDLDGMTVTLASE